MSDQLNRPDRAAASTGNWLIRSSGLPTGIWVLGFVSMLMDISSEMIHALLPIYMVTVLGTSALSVGIIEGIAEATASITKVFSGALSDWLGKRKLLAALGYGLAAFTKPIVPLAASIEWLIAARFIDRVGKGIRGAPRDALVADIAPPDLRGASFGLRQSLDTVGAFLGPLFAIGLMWLTADHFQAVFWIAVIPAFLSVGLIVVAVKEPDRPKEQRRVRMPLHRDELRRLGATYWWVVAVTAVFTLARFSEAFLILRAQSIGFSVTVIPVVLVVMSLAYSLSAYPVGVLSDRVNRTTLLAIGLVLLLGADLALAFASDIIWVGAGVVLWGLHMGFTQGLLATLIAESAPPELRGTAFGVFNLVTGIALLVASVVAGALWDMTGPWGTFLAGAAFTMMTLAGLFIVRVRLGDRTRV
ncbi:MFS transporter (plasmid) [Rhizobium leguminosarum]|uniref:MFS transporter n=2 Tax=Rhizobium leguminosarum TaxID=384 RepID=A0ABD7PKA1_RHILE|nr:MFS transporter [Rhizobium leguminosarum]TAU79596.1 MFS transporter [Rhizobium leguminosarum]TAV64722.1 MFS transporter [Rhizobium leguminosarum]TAV65180.1 MFS transporter [Rhizobium leguminosarum]TAW25169.1 MFS transporter [Rhizobium leguminosarum]TAW38940.1 MFS transporter [Rhizobium leguminosarum]